MSEFKVTITDASVEREVVDAIAAEHSYRETIANPEAKPEPVVEQHQKFDENHKLVEDETGQPVLEDVVVNQADIDAYKDQVPNPESKEDFAKRVIENIFRTILQEKVLAFRNRQQEPGLRDNLERAMQ